MNALKKISIQRRSKCQALEHSISIAAAERKKDGGGNISPSSKRKFIVGEATQTKEKAEVKISKSAKSLFSYGKWKN
jgi:hypothetical protein